MDEYFSEAKVASIEQAVASATSGNVVRVGWPSLEWQERLASFHSHFHVGWALSLAQRQRKHELRDIRPKQSWSLDNPSYEPGSRESKFSLWKSGSRV